MFEDDIKEIEDGAMWGVNVYWANVVALCRPVDGFVGLCVEFLQKMRLVRPNRMEGDADYLA